MIHKTRFWLLLSIGFTYALIFIGGFVRVSDSGLGCPDWPKCFDRWYPPLESSDIPEDFIKYYDSENYNCIDGEECEEFSITKAWIEYFNRLFGAITGLIILIATFYLFKLRSEYSSAFYLGISALVLTGVEGIIGKYVVSSGLEGSMITIHFLIALPIVSLLIMSYLTINWDNTIKNTEYKPDQVYTIKWIFILMIIGIILGTQIRENLEEFIPFEMIGSFKYIHSFLGIAIVMLTGVLLNKMNNEESKVNTKKQIRWLLNIFIIQVGLGYFMVFGGVPDFAKLIHMWLASVGIGIIVYVLMDIKLSREI